MMNKTILASLTALASLGALAGYYNHTYTGSDTNLKTLAVTTDGKFVLGTGDYAGEEWTWTKERVYDGFTAIQDQDNVVQRWFEPGWVNGDSKCNWAGYQTESQVVVTHISFLTRSDEYATRAIGCRFEGANSEDFSDAVTIYTVPTIETSTLAAGWIEVDITDATLLNTPFTYLRVVADDTYCGNFVEVEFYGKTWANATSSTPSAAPQNFSVSEDGDNLAFAWDVPSFSCQTVRVVRATAPGGPFSTVVATLPSTTNSCTEALSSLTAGVKYYYSACFLNNVDGTELEGPSSGNVSYRPLAEITFDSGTMAAIEYDHDYEATTATSAAKLFDGDTTTNPDVVNASAGNDGVKVGVDFGKGNEYVITSFKVFPSREWNKTLNQWVVGRSDGIRLAGSNNSSDWTSGADISDVCDLYKENAWDDTQLEWSSFETTVTNAYRYVYLKKDARSDLSDQRTDDFFGNVRELKLYGYLASNATSVLLAPEDLAAEWSGSKAVLTWTASANAVSYQVERSIDGGSTWTQVATGITDSSYTDRPDHPTKYTYLYRVASVGSESALAYTLGVVPSGTACPNGLVIIVR